MGGRAIGNARARFVNRWRSSRLRLSGNHDGGAGAAEFGQIAICGHADVEPWALPPNDRTIKIRLPQRPLQEPSSCASSMTCISKLARPARFWTCVDLLKRRRVQNLGP